MKTHRPRLLYLLLAPFLSMSFSHADPSGPQPDMKNPRPQDLNYVLELATDGERPRFHVDLYFRGSTDGASKLRLPNGWDTQTQLYNAISNLRAASPDTEIANTTQPHVKMISCQANQVVHVQYDVIQDWPGTAVRRGLFNRVILQKDYFYALGTALWVLPDQDPSRSVNIQLQWKNLPREWMLCNSFGTNEAIQSFQTTLEAFRKGVFLAGDFRIHALSVRDKPVQIVTRGKWRFPDAEFHSLVQKVMEAERSFWNDDDFPYFVVVLFPTDDAGFSGGESRTSAFCLYFSKDAADTAGMKFLLAHEMFHAWNASRLRLKDKSLYWFSEGFTDYYAALLLWRAKIISHPEYIQRCNDVLRRYYTSRCRNYSYERLEAEREGNGEAERQLYVRGNVLALQWDASIRSATGGEHSLDDVMRALLQAARGEDFSLSKDSIDKAAHRYLKEGVRQDIDRYAELGETIPVRADLLGPEAKASMIEVAASFDPGFDTEASYSKRIFTGVTENGPAHRAGLRNGQKWVEGGLVLDPDAMAEFTVEDSGIRKVVKYYPASAEKVRVLQYDAELQAAQSTRTLNTLSETEEKDGWKLLFDGKTFNGWRAYAGGIPTNSWSIADGCIKCAKRNGRPGNDILTIEHFTNFDFSFEWRIGRGGNSGVKYFLTDRQGSPGAPLYVGDDGRSAVGHEYQLLDDDRHPDGLNGPIRQTGALYSLLPPNSSKKLKPIGEFNQSRIFVQGKHVEHWLNGAKIVEYELESPELAQAIGASKYRNVPRFGAKFKTPILLQDHGDEIWFRNLKIRPSG